MDPFLIWVEQSAYSVWLREALTMWAFPFMLILHAIGMGLLAGIHIGISLRVLGLARQIPISAMRSFFPFLWLGLAINVFSGVSLLIAYPTKALTNPLFYIKLVLIAVALLGLRWMRRNVFGASLPDAAQRIALLCIFCWVSSIFAGRWLAYTYSKLMTS